MTNKERSKAIREELKKAGYKTSDFSIRSYDCGYSDASRIYIKNLTIDVSKIRDLLSKFRSVDYDEASGEILSGGNTYIIVDYDYEVVQSAEEKVQEELENLIEELDSSKKNGYVDYKIGDLRIFAREDSWFAYEQYYINNVKMTNQLFSDIPKERVSRALARSYAFAKARA